MSLLNTITTGLKAMGHNVMGNAIGGVGANAVQDQGSDIKDDSSDMSNSILSDLGSMANDASNTVQQEANVENQMNHTQALADESMDIEQAEDKTAKKGFDNLAGLAP